MKLIEMSGKTAAGTGLKNIRVHDLSDIDAAIWFLTVLVERNPNLTWGDIVNKNLGSPKMGWPEWLDNLGAAVYETGGNIIDGAGEKFGEAIRLFTDESVREGLMAYGEMGANAFSAYSTGGASAILPAMFGGRGDPQQQQIGFAAMGQQVKNAFGGINPTILYIGGGLLVLLLMVMVLKK